VAFARHRIATKNVRYFARPPVKAATPMALMNEPSNSRQKEQDATPHAAP
jgi:hypothetical protein